MEIGTDENSHPGADWIDYVRTNNAKRHLRSYISSVLNNEYKRCQHCHPLPGDEVIGFKANDGSITLHKRNCPTAIRIASQRRIIFFYISRILLHCLHKKGDSMLPIEFYEDEHFLYPVRVKIVRRVDRYRFGRDGELNDCIMEKLQQSRKSPFLFIKVLTAETTDSIVVCTADFTVHSVNELNSIMKSISAIDGVDEVQRVVDLGSSRQSHFFNITLDEDR